MTTSAFTQTTHGNTYIGDPLTASSDSIRSDQINITIHQTVQVVSAEPLPPSDLHLLNFGKPLSEQQRNQIEQALGFRISRVIAKQVEFNEEADFGPQVVMLHRLYAARMANDPPLGESAWVCPGGGLFVERVAWPFGTFPHCDSFATGAGGDNATVHRGRNHQLTSLARCHPSPEPGGKESTWMNLNSRPAANSTPAPGWGAAL